jgi:hypothetical protein
MKESKAKCHKEDSESEFVEDVGFSQSSIYISRLVWLAASGRFKQAFSSPPHLTRTVGPRTVTAHWATNINMHRIEEIP